MQRPQWFMLMLIAAFALSGCAREQIRDRRVLVMDFEDTVADQGVPDGAAIAELMEQSLANQPRIALVTRQGMRPLMEKALARQMSPVDLGERAGVDYVIIGSITKVNGNYVLNSRLLSVGTGEIVKNSSVTKACKQERDIYPCVQAASRGMAWNLKILATYADQAARGEPIQMPAFAKEGQR